MSLRFALVGLAAELSLRPLAAALRTRGYPVALIDLADLPADDDSMPPGDGPLVLVTSQHLAMTGAVYDAYTDISSHYAAPQTLRRRLSADLLVFVPHDLSEPVLPGEVDLLQTLDLYAAPDADSWWARAHVPTIVTGWVGSAWSDEAALSSAPLSRGVLFLTQVRWLMHQGGAEFVRSALATTLASGIAVKLPVWPEIAPLEAALRADGVPLIDPLLSATSIAYRTPLVVCNGPSSVLAEAAAAGHRPVCVLPPEGDIVFAGQLGALDVAICRDEDFGAAARRAGLVHEPEPRFDLDGFIAAIHDALAGRRP
ncbi:hypothetical protein BH11ACT1_BH11ACT1_23000 [soil metagenome]